MPLTTTSAFDTQPQMTDAAGCKGTMYGDYCSHRPPLMHSTKKGMHQHMLHHAALDRLDDGDKKELKEGLPVEKVPPMK